MHGLQALILAERPCSGGPRDPSLAVRPVLGVPLVGHVVRAARAAGAGEVTVAGAAADTDLATVCSELGCAYDPLPDAAVASGSAAAGLEPLARLLDHSRPGTLAVLDALAPLLRAASLRELWLTHEREQAAATRLVTAGGLGRSDRSTMLVLLARDAVRDALADWSAPVAIDRADLCDLFAQLVAAGRVVATQAAEDPAELTVVGDLADAAEAAAVLRRRHNLALLADGVWVEDPATTWVDLTVTLAPGARLLHGCQLEGHTTLGAGAEIGPYSRLVDTQVGPGVRVLDHCLVQQCVLEEGAVVGPFAHLRPRSRVRRGAKVGNFVELKQTDLGEGAKASHLSYLGDAVVGARTNIGAGTITCNYDGSDKHATHIGEGAFVGSDATLVAPLRVGDGAYIGAGSTITADVPAGALALGRARQVLREGWVARRRAARQHPKR